MTDTKFYKMMGVLQLLIAFINFYVAYVAFGALNTLAVLNIAVAVICTMAGVFCTVLAAKLFGALD
jgi:hypothetical protein